WRRDGKELFYVEGDTLTSVAVPAWRDVSIGTAAAALPKEVQHSAYEARFFRLNSLEFAFVEPNAFAIEALVDSDISKSDLLEPRSALRTLHEMECALTLPLL